jgi:hypothetical protein
MGRVEPSNRSPTLIVRKRHDKGGLSGSLIPLPPGWRSKRYAACPSPGRRAAASCGPTPGAYGSGEEEVVVQ